MRARPMLVALAVILVTAGVSVAAEKVDVVVLQNGTRVVGEVRSMKRGKLELKTDDMGTIQIEWADVVQVTAPEYFEVEDMRGRLRFGTLRPSADGSRLGVVNIEGEQALALPEVARIQLVKATFWDRISGSLDAGASYTSASELLQLDLDGNLRFRRPRFETSAVAEAVLTRQPDVEDTRRASLTLAYVRLFSTGQRILAQGALEQNRELGYEVRSSFTAGWGKYLARNTRNELVGGGGLSLNQEVPVDGEATTNVEAVLGFNYANFAYDFPNTDVQVGAMAYLGLTQWSRFRLEASAKLSREVLKDVYLGLKGYESYDSEPATEGAKRNDWGLTLTVGVRF
jgi:Holliday junction resolvase